MKNSPSWSFNLVKIFGIPVRIHLTFFLLLIWVAFDAQASAQRPLIEVVFILILFGCVLLHELGHALVARFFGIKTRDIVLYPFGGVASILSEPKPGPEFFIAIAGPLVNFALAALVIPFITWTDQLWGIGSTQILGRIFLANLILGLFNLIPALPMDGGRILRSILAVLGVKSATLIAARISQVLSIGLGILGVFVGNPVMLFIAVLVFSTATREGFRAKTKGFLLGYRVSEVMTEAEHLVTFGHGLTISDAVPLACKSAQTAFPVLYGRQVLGLVEKDSLLQFALTENEDAYVSSVMLREFPIARPDELVSDVLSRFELENRTPIVVVTAGEFMGLIVREQLIEYMMVQGLRRNSSVGDDPVDQEL